MVCTCQLDISPPQVSDPEQELTVTHLYYTAWPDHGVPRNAMSVISFIHRVRKEHPACLDLPLLVHCSAGVGRTGTFILLDSVMQQIKREGTLSVFNLLKNVRGQRMKMVQTKVSFTLHIIHCLFCHHLLTFFVCCIEGFCVCVLPCRHSMCSSMTL